MPPTVRSLPCCLRAVAAMLLACIGSAASAAEGGLYIAGAGFSFQQAAERALAQNVGGSRFFVLTLPPSSVCVNEWSRPTACCWCASAT